LIVSILFYWFPCFFLYWFVDQFICLFVHFFAWLFFSFVSLSLCFHIDLLLYWFSYFFLSVLSRCRFQSFSIHFVAFHLIALPAFHFHLFSSHLPQSSSSSFIVINPILLDISAFHCLSIRLNLFSPSLIPFHSMLSHFNRSIQFYSICRLFIPSHFILLLSLDLALLSFIPCHLTLASLRSVHSFISLFALRFISFSWRRSFHWARFHSG
jgi:hypothetical protein